MSLIVDFIVEAFFEIFCEGFVYLFTAFIPESKITDKARKIITVVCFTVACILLIGLFVGVILLVESGWHSPLGWILVALSVAYVLSAIILKILSRRKNKRS